MDSTSKCIILIIICLCKQFCAYGVKMRASKVQMLVQKHGGNSYIAIKG